ncbi:ATP-binding protein [Aeoliella sp.]|uniref:ATP-binding protein n=1 Tax=Aeoliella sp. TaxID=2795800 RepID=UPI003CCC0969
MPDDIDTTDPLIDCDKEPIHIPGTIQDHGCLLAFDSANLELCQWSQNAELHTGIRPTTGAPFDRFFGDNSLMGVQEVVEGPESLVHTSRLQLTSTTKLVSASLHRVGPIVIVEFDGASESSDTLGNLPLVLNSTNQRLQAEKDLSSLYGLIATEVRSFSGFDRAMVYRFQPDGHGEVVGESVEAQRESFLGLHYPATDIPQQARRLYCLNTVRSIADIESTPCPLVPEINPLTKGSLDLSFSRYRSVSPVHVEYLRNMGVRASMSISILQEGELWGLIACHHYSALPMSIERLAACEIMGVMAGTYLTAMELADHNWQLASRRSSLSKSLQSIAAAREFEQGIRDELATMCGLVDADGVAACWNGGVDIHGSTPSPKVLQSIVEELQHTQSDGIKATTSIAEVGSETKMDSSLHCGALVVPIDSDKLSSLVFLRKEFEHEVKWAGDPHAKAVETEVGIRLSPRLSFEAWRETVRGHSRDWTQVDLAMAEDLRSGLAELLGRRASELERMNRELSRLNEDLDSFAYAASHDLREPLRGLNQTVHMLLQHLGDTQDEELVRRCDALRRLTAKLDQLVQGLLRLSRAGRGDLSIAEFKLSEAVERAVELNPEFAQSGSLEISVSEQESIVGDFDCITELLSNLIANGIKYNDKQSKKVVIGVETCHKTGPAGQGHSPYIYVRDNGVGIDPGQVDRVFDIFRRLPNADNFGAGSGAGLAIVKKIVQRHEGEVWMESTPSIGSTVWFSLGKEM